MTRKNLETLKNQGILGSFFVLEYILSTKVNEECYFGIISLIS